MSNGGGSAASPLGVNDSPPSQPGAGGLFEEDNEELEMHSKAFHIIENLKALKAKVAEDGRR